MKRIVFIVLALLVILATNAFSAVVERPSRKFPEMSAKQYGWLHEYQTSYLSIRVNDTASKFLSEESLRRYFKLKMRNFIKAQKITKNPEGTDINYIDLELELYKYNKTSTIYYGLISLKVDSAINYEVEGERIFKITNSIAGSEGQLTNFIKSEIDWFVEIFAEDFYFIEDLKTNNDKK